MTKYLTLLGHRMTGIFPILLFIGLAFWGCSDNDECIDESKITNNPCDEYYAPVCGCDGETYSNDCFAENGGVTEWIEGECD